MSYRHRTPIGLLGEKLAADFLLGEGYALAEKNFRTTKGEIDLVMRDGDQYVFVEVKARTSRDFGIPEEAIGGDKIVKLHAAAFAYFAARGIETDNFRIDSVAVEVDERGRVREIRHHLGIGGD